MTTGTWATRDRALRFMRTVVAALAAWAGVAASSGSSAATNEAAGRPAILGGRPDFTTNELPPGRFRAQVEALSPESRQRALTRLRDRAFPAADTESLHADAEGGILYADAFLPPPPDAPAKAGEARIPDGIDGALNVAPFPPALKFHSRPGATNVIFLDFDGHPVSGTQWNSSLGRDPIPAVAFSTDADRATFSDAEQLAIRRVWQRVAEDYAPFDVDVTTEAPAVFTPRTAHALITRSTDAGGADNPYPTSGGVAYVDVFGQASFASFRPAWIYSDNLSGNENYIGEATSHEVGHNMGLSHDGTTSGSGYYEGHGSGATAWAPIMGFSYLKTVTQWSKGDYYLANNTQDDLAIISGKLSYRADDHGSAPAGAVFLQLTGGTNILSTTPETDPANANTANKGTIATTGDVDLWAFVTGSGPVRIDVKPWVGPSGLRGGNLDVRLRLLNSAGAVVAEDNPPLETLSSIQATLTNGVYCLEVSGTGAGTPLANPPDGYTDYASIGQYFISGWLQPAGGVATPPSAQLTAADIAQVNLTGHPLTVTFFDNVAIDVSTIDGNDIRVTGPNGYSRLAALQGVGEPGNGTPRTATYALSPPGATWQPADNGTYEVWMAPLQVADTAGAWVPAQRLGAFECRVPAVLYSAPMSSNPAWTLDSGWAFGPPAGSGGDPSSGWDGANVLGYELGGTYPKNLGLRYATTPVIDCTAATAVSLSFRRWLGVYSGDTASIEAKAAGGAWTPIWSAPGTVLDGAWISQEIDLAAIAAGRADVQIRWAMASNGDNARGCGWNLDNVLVMGAVSGSDTLPPGASLHAQTMTLKDQPVYAFTVTYTDNTAVARATLDGTDILVTGPGAYSNGASLAGADNVNDATPLTATYRLPGPGGIWDVSENGTYHVFVLAGSVTDTAGNAVTGVELGTFAVAVPTQTWSLVTGVGNPDWGSVSPSGGVFPDGRAVTISATPAPYYVFSGWGGDLSGTVNPATLTMSGNRSVYAAFSEAMTTNHPTPLGWLAQHGCTNNFEQGVERTGANGYALWESYEAGLNPDDPASVVRITRFALDEQRGLVQLGWQSVSGRVYSVYYAPSLPPAFEPFPGGTDRPWTQPGYTGLLWVTSGFWQVRARQAP